MQNKQYIRTNLLLYCSKKFYKFNQVLNNESEQRNFTHLIRCQTMKVKPYIILLVTQCVSDLIRYIRGQ
jgi:hypothetical protein